jgi:phospholipid N-methyltransferase
MCRFGFSLWLVFCAVGSVAQDFRAFIRSAIKSPRVVGAIMPSSADVGEELTRFIVQAQRERPSRALRILEVGAGTGSMTESIISHMRSTDHVDVIEISPEFCEILHKKFDKYPNVSIHCISILDWKPTYCYDFIVSTLPFNSFKFDLVNNIINHMNTLILDKGIISYIAYTGMAQLRGAFLFGQKKAEHRMKMKRINEWRSQYEIARNTIIKNIPPATVYHLCIRKSAHVR